MATAWGMVGFDGQIDGRPAQVRVAGGRALYEAVDFQDATRGEQVRLARLHVGADGLRAITRYVDPDAVLEVVYD